MYDSIPWKRFWCRREDTFSLSDRGFLSDPEGRHGEVQNPNLITFDQLQRTPCLILLGEPGVGKSWSLKADVDAFLHQTSGPPAVRIDLRSVGSEERLHRKLFDDPSFQQWVHGTHELHVFLDSLDECLLRIETVAAILADELPNYPLERMKLRIACRTAAWPTILEKALTNKYGAQGFAAAELVPLRRRDVEEAATLSGLANADAFLARIDELQIASFAIKPVTLGMLISTFLREGDLPNSVLELYEKGCLILCEEQNESRRAAGRTGSLSPRDRVAICSRIAAATQFGNRFAVWTGTEAAGVPAEDVRVADLSGGTEHGEITVNNEAILESLSTGLFSSRGRDRLGWAHQTYAEFLAARYCSSHALPIQQLRSLIFHPRRNRVIPQVREVASWVALQNEQLFADIAAADPEVLLGSASPSLSDAQREVVTRSLLKRSDEGDFLHFRRNLQLRNLTHPGLAEQLRAVIADADRSMTTRYFAINIARDCEANSIGDLLADLALSDNETYDLRALAADAVADIGTYDDRLRLKPLLNADRDTDPKDEIRGSALRAIYPGQEYDDSMWEYLEHPRQSNFFGAYNSFMTYMVLPKLDAANLPAALRWCEHQEHEDIGPVADLQQAIQSFAIEHIDAEGVADLLAKAVLERSKSGHQFARGLRSKGFEEILKEDHARRRRFLEAFLPLLDRENVYLLTYPLSLLFLEDLDWLLDRVVNDRFPTSSAVEAWMVSHLVFSSQPSAVESVWRACKNSPVLAQACKGLFDAQPLDSDEAHLARKLKKDLLKKNGLQVAAAMEPRCDAALRLSEAGDVDAWLSLLSEMSVVEGGLHYMHLSDMEVQKLPGWLAASDEMKARMVAAAKVFLAQTTFRNLAWFPSNKIPNGVFAAVNAIVFLNEVDRAYLEMQDAAFWAQWIPSLIGDSRAQYEKNAAIATVLRMAAVAAPEPMNARLLEQLDFDSQEHRYFFGKALIEAAYSESLARELLKKLQRNDLTPGVQGDLLYWLIDRKFPGAEEWSEQTLASNHNGERERALAKALVTAADDAGWGTIWPMIQSDGPFGRALLEDISYAQAHRASFTAALSDAHLGDLFIWLLEQYPPDDRMVSGAMGPMDTIRFLREGVLEQLKRRSTFEACDALARAELHLPQHRWLRYHFAAAEVMACSFTWKAQAPRDIIAIAANAQLRFVESGAQLLTLILESLGRLQAKLHGDLAAVGDLWNSRGKDWWPKEEEDISDYVARHLREDLADRNIIVNREVQIRRGRRGEMPGQNTDIHVDATPVETMQAQLYGRIAVIIEVKGSWNAALMQDMEAQLRDRYLKNNECRTGLYLVAHFMADRWIPDDRRRRSSTGIDIQDLRTQLAAQAVELSGGVHLESFVLDGSLDSTNTTEIEDPADSCRRSDVGSQPA